MSIGPSPRLIVIEASQIPVIAGLVICDPQIPQMYLQSPTPSAPWPTLVKDAAYLLHAIAGKDLHDNYTSAIPFKIIPDYVAAHKFSALGGKRLGIPRNLIDLTNDATAAPIIPAFNAALKALEAAGDVIVGNTNFTGVSCPHFI
jgi:Asp-tRNA(Asn)/Glu-tRNA(Gln) amidotransferase A subunit family amidase